MGHRNWTMQTFVMEQFVMFVQRKFNFSKKVYITQYIFIILGNHISEKHGYF